MSSPPARGCSDRLGRRGPHALVVPASAGVFRHLPQRSHLHPSRPRQRGGVPKLGLLVVSDNMSSPPARGCSPEPRRAHRGLVVVPASAGVFPPGAHREGKPPGRPRQRGGVPPVILASSAASSSSPPARGCSGLVTFFAGFTEVVPASAGVFRESWPDTGGGGSRPRQRGGVPAGPHSVPLQDESSPPARGCSPRRGLPHRRWRVVPASAGVFLRQQRASSRPGSRPRQRGGVPVTGADLAIYLQSSPPARGCSRLLT